MAQPAPVREGFTRPSDAQRRKIGPLTATILLHIIAIALLFLQRGAPIPRKIEESLTTVFLPESHEDKDSEAKSKTKEKKAEESAAAPKQPVDKPPVEPPKAPEPPPIPLGPSWLTMSKDEFAASDISKMSRAQKASGDDGEAQGDSKSAYGPGDGPGGVRLFNADWYRPPTNAELAGYLKAGSPRTGWGLIACQTVANYHVDNCQTLGESPLGSGFGRAVREAAWQFLVLPPRINGKPQVGSWVRIRITYGETAGPS